MVQIVQTRQMEGTGMGAKGGDGRATDYMRLVHTPKNRVGVEDREGSCEIE